MKTYAIIDLQSTGFMEDTWEDPMTTNELRLRFWYLDDTRTKHFKDFTKELIEDVWGVQFYPMQKGMSEKTTNWYPYKKHGSYYRLYKGILQFCPMLENGERSSDEEIGEVEMAIVGHELDHVIEELQKKL